MANTFAEFDEVKEDWLSYAELMEQYFIANDIKEEKRRAIIFVPYQVDSPSQVDSNTF